MAAIGVSVGAVCYLMKSFEELITAGRYEFIERFTQGPEANLGAIWAWITFIAVIMVAVGSLIVVYIAP